MNDPIETPDPPTDPPESDTPRTNAMKFPIFYSLNKVSEDVVMACHMAEMERELAAARVRIAELDAQATTYSETHRVFMALQTLWDLFPQVENQYPERLAYFLREALTQRLARIADLESERDNWRAANDKSLHDWQLDVVRLDTLKAAAAPIIAALEAYEKNVPQEDVWQRDSNKCDVRIGLIRALRTAVGAHLEDVK